MALAVAMGLCALMAIARGGDERKDSPPPAVAAPTASPPASTAPSGDVSPTATPATKPAEKVWYVLDKITVSPQRDAKDRARVLEMYKAAVERSTEARATEIRAAAARAAERIEPTMVKGPVDLAEQKAMIAGAAEAEIAAYKARVAKAIAALPARSPTVYVNPPGLTVYLIPIDPKTPDPESARHDYRSFPGSPSGDLGIPKNPGSYWLVLEKDGCVVGEITSRQITEPTDYVIDFRRKT